MNVVITGAGGQLGQDMVHVCKKRDVNVHAVDSRHLDITDYQSVKKYLHEHYCDLLINCAAYNAVDQAEEDWKTAFRINGLGVRNLVHAVNECRGTIVHYSTDFVFDGKSTRPYTIADTPHPINRYGESKLLGEHFVRDLACRYYLIRVSWVFGTGRGKLNFVKKVIEWSKNGRDLHIVDDQISSPTYTVDLAEATLDLVNSGMYGLYHITNSGSCSRYEWASLILERLGWKGTIVPVSSKEFPTPARRPRFSVLDNFGSHEILRYNLPDWKDATRRFLQEGGGN
jgi:dTDP-4-dehydrorhamnose reductase